MSLHVEEDQRSWYHVRRLRPCAPVLRGWQDALQLLVVLELARRQKWWGKIHTYEYNKYAKRHKVAQTLRCILNIFIRLFHAVPEILHDSVVTTLSA